MGIGLMTIPTTIFTRFFKHPRNTGQNSVRSQWCKTTLLRLTLRRCIFTTYGAYNAEAKGLTHAPMYFLGTRVTKLCIHENQEEQEVKMFLPVVTH